MRTEADSSSEHKISSIFVMNVDASILLVILKQKRS